MKNLTKSSKNWALLVVFFFGTTVLSAGAAFAAAIANLEAVQGEVRVHTSGAAPEAWQPAANGTALSSGDSVKTTDGTCSIVYSDQATISLKPNTNVTIQEQDDSQDIMLSLGNLGMDVNKEKMTKPFQVVTPTAVGAVRGTNVDFGFNESGELTVDLHDGNLHVYNDEAGMVLDLAGGNKIKINYDAEAGILKIQNDCGSKGIVTFSVLGTEYAENPCEEREIELSTAEGQTGLPEPPPGDNPEDPRDDIPQGPVSPIE